MQIVLEENVQGFFRGLRGGGGGGILPPLKFILPHPPELQKFFKSNFIF